MIVWVKKEMRQNELGGNKKIFDDGNLLVVYVPI